MIAMFLITIYATTTTTTTAETCQLYCDDRGNATLQNYLFELCTKLAWQVCEKYIGCREKERGARGKETREGERSAELLFPSLVSLCCTPYIFHTPATQAISG